VIPQSPSLSFDLRINDKSAKCTAYRHGQPLLRDKFGRPKWYSSADAVISAVRRKYPDVDVLRIQPAAPPK
jgi:hypothetical protein